MSTGFAVDASTGRSAASVERVSSGRTGNSRPAASQASAQRIPSPPALVSTATVGPSEPAGSRGGRRRRELLTRVSARSTPAWRNTASTAVSDPARAAVCDPAAFRPARERPLFIARIGFSRASRRASRRTCVDCRTTRGTSTRGRCRGRPPTTRAGRWTRRPLCCRSRRMPRRRCLAPRRVPAAPARVLPTARRSRSARR